MEIDFLPLMDIADITVNKIVVTYSNLLFDIFFSFQSPGIREIGLEFFFFVYISFLLVNISCIHAIFLYSPGCLTTELV